MQRYSDIGIAQECNEPLIFFRLAECVCAWPYGNIAADRKLMSFYNSAVYWRMIREPAFRASGLEEGKTFLKVFQASKLFRSQLFAYSGYRYRDISIHHDVHPTKRYI